MTDSPSRNTVLVTGAAGKTGRAVTRSMTAAGFSVRALARHPEQAAALEAGPAAEVVVGDLGDDDAMHRAVAGATAVYHACPNVHPDEVGIGRRMIAAAQSTGVEHFVFHSVLHPQVEAMPHHWAKLRVEELVFESGLPFTILQPAPYMQNILGQWADIVEEGTFTVPYALSTRVSMIDLDDVALAAAQVLTRPEHVGATYELSSHELLDQTEIAQRLSAHLDRPIRAERMTIEQWQQASGSRLDSYGHDALVKMFAYYERHGMAGGSRVAAVLLGRSPRTFAEFLEHSRPRNA